MSKYNENNILNADGEYREEFEEYVRNTLGKKVQLTDALSASYISYSSYIPLKSTVPAKMPGRYFFISVLQISF